MFGWENKHKPATGKQFKHRNKNMEYIEKTESAIIEHLESLSSSDLVAIHNEYCQSQNYSDDEIYSNDEGFFNMFFEGKVIEAVRAVSYGEYSYPHTWVKFNGYANLETTYNPLAEGWIDLKAIAADILENPENYFGIELEEVEPETED